MVHPMKFLASVGLTQAHPNHGNTNKHNNYFHGKIAIESYKKLYYTYDYNSYF